MALAVVAAIGSVSAGVAAAAAATTVIGTVAAYATIAGGVLTGIGAVTGKKSLMKIGAILSIGGGLATAANNWANSAATAAAEKATETAAAQAAWDAGESVAGDVAANATQVGADAVQAAAGAGDIAGQMGGAQGYTTAGMTTPVPAGATAALETAPVGIDAAAPAVADASAPLTVSDAVAPTVSVNGPAPVTIDPYQQYQSTMLEAGQRNLAAGAQAADSPIQQWLNKITGGAKAVGSVIKDNKELIQLGGTMLGAAYGPQAEQLDLQKSIWNSQQKNLNSPVRLYYRKA
jgi:hypothetical protein